MRYLFAFAILVIVAMGGWFYLLMQEKRAPMPSIQTAEPTNFAQTGTLRFAPVTAGQATGTVEYIVNDATTTRALVMDEFSICGANNGTLPCMAMSITYDKLFDQRRAMVEGTENNGVVLVRKLYIVAEDEQATPAPPGSVFISWHQATELIKACQVSLAMQTHAHDVYLDLKDGSKVRAVEPMIDDLFKVVDQARSTCGSFPVATE